MKVLQVPLSVLLKLLIKQRLMKQNEFAAFFDMRETHVSEAIRNKRSFPKRLIPILSEMIGYDITEYIIDIKDADKKRDRFDDP